MTNIAPKKPPVVARCTPRGVQHATTYGKSASGNATSVQHESLKALADKALSRNTPCNTDATTFVAYPPKNGPSFVACRGNDVLSKINKIGAYDKNTPPPPVARASELRSMQEKLLILAGSLGLPDALVHGLPESELSACCEQVTWMQDADTAHKLLGFYLRSLAGEEAALPGSLAARDAPARRAHVQKLREPKP